MIDTSASHYAPNHAQETIVFDNATLQDIRDRRSVRTFTSDPVTDVQLQTILEAARWAPSGHNSQPWDFVVVRDAATRSALGQELRRITFSWGGLASAPVMIVVAVNESRDPVHFVEDGAVASQNLCLAAQSLGLGSSWAGVYSRDTGRRSVERSIAQLVGLPKTHRVISVVPIGTGLATKSSTRRPLDEMVHLERYTLKDDSRIEAAVEPSTDAKDDDGTRGVPRFGRRRSLTEPAKFS